MISDTITRPTAGMLDAMMSANVGDDVFEEDPTINQLQSYAAGMFGMEDALFCPSGTMTNQIAINCHTQPLDEMICDVDSHVYQYETGGFAFNSGISVALIQGHFGKITSDQVEGAIKADKDWLPRTSLVVLENTCNRGGGSYYTLEEIAPISNLCREKGLAIHLDGARLFNALVQTGERPEAVGKHFDSISICLSKGLGAPVGSLLIGKKTLIKQARRYRKVMGGGMRQAGYLAAAGQYALENNIERLKVDNDRAKMIGGILESKNYVERVKPVASNIVIFDLENETGESFISRLKDKGITAAGFGPKTVRFVFHLDIKENMMDYLVKVLGELEN
ncbi:MAG: threonine aldolase [Saprospiraceae bacterium]|nr:threonine aldolase [Saprospiraceae bacterium]